MTMESLGDILRRISARSIARTTNGGGGTHPARSTSAVERCPTCNDSGWVTRRMPVGHPEFGQAVPVPVLSQRRGIARPAASRCAASATWGRCPAPPSPATRDGGAALRPWQLDVTCSRKPSPRPRPTPRTREGWLVLTGPSGSGKTHLAAAVANRCIERQQTTFFIMVADLLDHLRAAYAPDSLDNLR